MRRFVSGSLLLVQLMLPTTVGAATEAPLAPIFVTEPQPEFATRHAGGEAWAGHRDYHRWIHVQIQVWEDDWRVRQVTPPYTQVKREMLRYMLTEHREAHMEKEAPARSLLDSSAVDESRLPGMAETPLRPRLTGRAALFTPLPKESHRLLQARQQKLNRQN